MNLNKHAHNILIVDDLPENLKLLAEMLQNEGYYVRPVTNGKLALKAANAIPPDLVLLDIQMPEINGFEVCQQLKSGGKTHDIPVIFLSASADTETIVKGFELGATDYITKPFKALEVLSRIKTHLELSDARKQIAQKNHKQRELIHVLCHDLQNSLSNIGNFLELCDDETFSDMKDLLIESANNGNDIIRLVRQLSSLDEGKLELELDVYYLNDLIEQALSILSTKLQEKNIQAVINIDSSIQIKVDNVSFINSVIINLITNAIKFSFPDSKILLEAEETTENVLITIEDFGIGMSEKLCGDIFKINKPTTRTGTLGELGTGYGMPLVKDFVTAYGGNIDVISCEKNDLNDKHGTKFFIHLPCVKN